jgi:hypothetical protein
MKITGPSHLFKWENLHNWWLTKYFFAPLYVINKEHIKATHREDYFEVDFNEIKAIVMIILEHNPLYNKLIHTITIEIVL